MCNCDDIRNNAELCSGYAWALWQYGQQERARRFAFLAEQFWQQWIVALASQTGQATRFAPLGRRSFLPSRSRFFDTLSRLHGLLFSSGPLAPRML